MPIPIKLMFPEWTAITICLILAFAINTLERMSIGFSFFYFKSRRINFEIGLTILYYFPVIFEFM